MKNKIFVVYKAQKDGSPDPTSVKCYRKRVLASPFKKRAYLDLTPFTVPINLKNALTADNYRFNLEGAVTVEISTDTELMQVAGEKLTGLKQEQIAELATDVIIGKIRLTVAEFNIEEINLERDKFFSSVAYDVEYGLKYLGLKAVNFNYTDMSDEDGYFDGFWREKALKAIEQAKAEVEKEKEENSPDEGV